MKTITSACGKVETVTVRRTEAAEAQQIDSLISPSAVAVFGRINVIDVLEKANLAVTLATDKNEILAHASFFDHPIRDIVDQARWEPFLHKHFSAEKCTPLNTLFLHLFVAQPSFTTESVKEIMRAVFNAITELEYVCLLSPNTRSLEPALEEVFEPMECLSDPGPRCLALVCRRHKYCPRLHVRPARLEDFDEFTQIFAEQTKELSNSDRPHFLAELAEAQDGEKHTAVCESDGIAVGFISVSADVNVKLLNDCFELSMFDGLYEPQQAEQREPAAQQDEPTQTQDGAEQASVQQSALPEDSEVQGEDVSASSCTEQRDKTPSTGPRGFSDRPNAFCIQLFSIDKNYEMRSVDFLPHIFKLFPDRDFCVITAPKLTPEFPLLQSFLRVAPRPSSLLPHELYIFHRSGLLKSVEVRPAVSADRPAVCALMERLSLQEALLDDLDQFYQARRDPDGTPLQAFVAQVQSQVVGILIIRNEQDIEYLRSHYNIENFIYFSHHRYEEHAQLCHFALNPVFQHHAKHFLKEALRLAHKSCLYHREYPPHSSQGNSCAGSLTSVLHCAVPVRPRRQIIYPLEELGINAPSRQITKDQAPFALYLISRKLTMEPKVTVNARIVVVGASDTGLSFLEVLAFCPHLRFNNLTLISTNGFPGDYDHEYAGFLSTSHAYCSTDPARLSLRSSVSVVTGRMVGIDREAKHVRVSGSRRVPYDHLVLCTGLQYQVPCPTGVDVNQPVTNRELQPPPGLCRYTGLVPSNLFTLNDQQDCEAAHRWLCSNFVELEDNAIVYGSSIDVYTCVETLLGLGVRGSRIHVVLSPSEPAVPCFSDPNVERAVAKALDKSEVQVHRNCLLAQMNDGERPEPLRSVSFTTDGPPLRLQCGVFLNLSCKGVDYDAFKSINDACLVYDGRLVIDATFHTNDPAIRAAGPLTKFSRRYYADECRHACFSSREVGRDLAHTLLPFFDPTLEPATDPPPDADRLVPVYKQAKIQGGKLPGGFSYLHVTKPSIPNPAAEPAFVQHGKEIVTGRIETGNYFCLRLSRYETVETITCLSLKPLPVSNYLCLYGKHQLLLNQLCTRYDQDLICDLYSFFRESWSMAIYQDRFPDFELEIQQIIASAKLQDGVSLQEQIQRLVEGKLEVQESPALFLQQLFERSDGLAALKTITLDYLRYNRNQLPMFALPGLL